MHQRKRILSKRTLSLLLALLLLCSLLPAQQVQAKTYEAQEAQTVFVYLTNKQGEQILIKTLSPEDLESLNNEETYSMSFTDNLPTTCYAEAQGFSLEDFINYIKGNNSITREMTFSGQDCLYFMADDSGNAYSRSITAEEASESRKFVNGLYQGWAEFGSSRWENTSDEEVNQYKEKAWDNGEETPVILSVKSLSGRTTQSVGAGGTSEGIKDYITANGGVVKGCLSKVDKLNTKSALSLYIPMNKEDFLSGKRTAYENFRWIYNIKLDMKNRPDVQSKGTVAKPKAVFSPNADGKTMTVTLSCDTPDAEIYYDLGTAAEDTKSHQSAQTRYQGPFTVAIPEDPAKNPITFYARAVKEGYSDAGNQTMTYYQSVPKIKVTGQTILGEEQIVLRADASVDEAEWNAWTTSLTGISARLATEDQAKAISYEINSSDKTITLSEKDFTRAGTYVIIAEAKAYKDGKWNAAVKRRAPNLIVPQYYDLGKDLTISFSDTDSYHEMTQVKCFQEGTENGTIIRNSYLQKQTGKLTIKSSYFSAAGSMMKTAGTYKLQLTNDNYEPMVKEVTVTIIDQSGVSEALSKIQAIGTVGRNSGPAIKAARAAYQTLTTETERNLVTNYTTLQEAEKAYASLVTAEKSTALAKLKNYKNPDLYRQGEKLQLQQILSQAESSIEQAAYIEDINAILDRSMKKMDGLKTDAQLTKEEAVSKLKISLGTVTGVKVTCTSYHTAKIRWTKKAAAAGYYIYRAEGKSKKYRKIATIRNKNTTSYTNKKLKTGTKYSYKVAAYGTAGGQTVVGAFSSARSVRPILKKTTVRLKGGKGKATVRWKRVSGAKGYQIYRSTKKKRGYKRVKTIAKASTVRFVNKKLKTGKRYYYKVRAYRKVNGKKVYSTYSAAKSVKVK